MDSSIRLKLVIITCVVPIYLSQQVQADHEWSLRLLHTNNMDSRFHQISAFSHSECLPKEAKLGECYGGFARLATLLKIARGRTSPMLYLDAGNVYFPRGKYNVQLRVQVAAFLNMLHPDVISLGTHEFDQGIDNLVDYINAINSDVVGANIDPHNEPKLAATKLAKSVILNTSNGHKIGVIGYLTPHTKVTSSPRKVEFLDEITCIREEVERLGREGVNIFIALGHSGYNRDKQIAAEVEGLDLVIGGRSHIFLYNGPFPDVDEPGGPYPTEVIGVGGRKVYVAHAYAYTKYIGNLKITFDSSGEITKIDGNPILLDNRIPEAPEVLEEVNKLQPTYKKSHKLLVRNKDFTWDTKMDSCGMTACDLGSIIAESILNYNKKAQTRGSGWSDIAIAMFPSGIIKTSLDDDQITLEAIMEMLPTSEQLVMMELTGDILIQVLESSLDDHTSHLLTRCLQAAGLKVSFDTSKPIGERAAVEVRCASCEIHSLQVLDRNATYRVLMTESLSRGGSGYSMLSSLRKVALGGTIDEAVIDYFAANSIIPLNIVRIQYPQGGH